MTLNVSALKQKTLVVAKKLERALGIPRPAKRRAKPLDMLIATVLSQNTNDKNSHRAYQQLRTSFPVWESVLRASNTKLIASIRVGGMANQKSVRIKKILSELRDRFGKLDLAVFRKMTNEEIYETLLSLDGVGFKTASCVLLFSLGRDVFPVDTHVHRICNRLGFTRNCPTPEKTFEQMKNIVPKGRAYSLHTNMIRFGRKICRSAAPLCGMCPLYTECRYEKRKFFAKLKPPVQFNTDVNFMLLDNV